MVAGSDPVGALKIQTRKEVLIKLSHFIGPFVSSGMLVCAVLVTIANAGMYVGRAPVRESLGEKHKASSYDSSGGFLKKRV